MRSILSRDFIAGLIAIAVGGIYLYFTLQLRTSPLADSLGPAGVPRILGGLCVGLGVLLCAQAAYGGIRGNPSGDGATMIAPAGDTAPAAGRARQILRATGMLGIGIGYLLIVGRLGYLPAVAILIGAVALYQGVRFSWRTPVIAIGGAAVLWAVFQLLLGVNMPAGLF